MRTLPDRFMIAVPLLLVAQALLVHWAGSGERPPQAPDLSSFPAQIAGLSQVRDEPIEADVARELHADRLLNRTYENIAAPILVNVFVAWFRSQLNGAQPHSPKVCLPGSGWIIESSSRVSLITVEGIIKVNRMLVSNANQHAIVLYWYQNPRRVVATEWEAKLWTVFDSIRYRRTDLALVRVVVWQGHDGQQAAMQAAIFASQAYPILRLLL